MILEERIYVIKVGKVQEFLGHVERQGFPLAQRILGGPLGYFTTEIGDLSQVIHLWAYESLADRDRRFAEIFAHPDWLAFIADVLPLIERMETRILQPARFSPLTLEAVRAMNNA